MIGMVDLNIFIDSMTTNAQRDNILMSVLAYLVFGQIIDN